MTIPMPPRFDVVTRMDTPNGVPVWSAEDMRAYGAACAAAERERCAALCDQRSVEHWRAYKSLGSHFFADPRTEAFSDEAEECAKAIRALAAGTC